MLKRVLVFGMTANYGGPESLLINYYKNIDREKVRFDFLAYSENIAYCDEIKELGGNIYTVTPKSKNPFLNKAELKEFFKNNASRYAALWCNLCEITNLDVLKYAKKYGIKKRIIHSHSSRSTRGGLGVALHKINKPKVAEYATDFWACSGEAGKWFFDDGILNGPDFKIVNNAIDTSKFKFSQEKRDEKRKELSLNNEFVIGHVGLFSFAKNQEFLIDIFEKVYNKQPESILLLAGAGDDQEKIKEKVKALGLEAAVKFLGARNDIAELMQAMDVFVLPSRFEGFPIVGLEAQAADLPCVFSENITKDIGILAECSFLSLEESTDVWADEILQFTKKHGRKDTSRPLIDKGFDIKDSADWLSQQFIKGGIV